MAQPEPQEPPRLILEVTPHRCAHPCSEQYQPVSERPLLVKVSLNDAMKRELFSRGCDVPEDHYVCTNWRCGALANALKILAPLQEAVK